MDFRARADALLRRVRALPDAALEGKTEWRGGQVERRHGIYLASELILAEADRAPSAAAGAARQLGSHVLRAAWDFRTLLQPIAPELLDRDPGHGERPLRAAISHVLDGHAFWSFMFAWWIERSKDEGDLPLRPAREDFPEHILAGDRAFEGAADELVRTFDGLVRDGVRLLEEAEDAGILHADVSFNARKITIPLSYYPRRWTAHLREHAIEIEKTLVLLGRGWTEQERIARMVGGSLGDLEAAWWRAGSEVDESALSAAEAQLASIEEAASVGT